MSRFRLPALAFAVSLTLLVAACSSSKGSSTASSSSAPAPTVAPPSGKPISIGVMTNLTGTIATPEVVDGAKAGVAAINAAGGIKDPAGGPNRPLQVVSCDSTTTTNPNAAAQCARQEISAGVVADIGKFGDGADEDTALASGGIVMLGTTAVGANDFTNADSYPLNGGALTSVAGTAAALQAAGATKIALITLDVATGHILPTFVTPLLKNHAADLTTTVYLPTDPSADLTSFLAQVVSSKPDGVVVALAAQEVEKAVPALQQAGFTGKIGVPASTVTSKVLSDMGSAANGWVLASNYDAVTDTSNPTIKQFTDDMAKFAKGAALSEFSLNSWLSVHILASILATAPTIDAPAVKAAVNGYKVSYPGVFPDFTLGVKNIYLPLPRVFRGTIQYQTVTNGNIVATTPGQFADLNALAH